MTDKQEMVTVTSEPQRQAGGAPGDGMIKPLSSLGGNSRDFQKGAKFKVHPKGLWSERNGRSVSHQSRTGGRFRKLENKPPFTIHRGLYSGQNMSCKAQHRWWEDCETNSRGKSEENSSRPLQDPNILRFQEQLPVENLLWGSMPCPPSFELKALASSIIVPGTSS